MGRELEEIDEAVAGNIIGKHVFHLQISVFHHFITFAQKISPFSF